MTNEEKLLILLQVAVENGWEDENDIEYMLTFEHTIIKNQFIFEDGDYGGHLYSINDLVTNFEEGEVSFIEALCNANDMVDDWHCGNETYHCYFDLFVNLIRDYSSTPTSKRLEWLFETFNHLLIES